MTKLAALALMVGAILVVFVACGEAAPSEPSVATIQRASPPIPPPAPTAAPDEGGGNGGGPIVGTPVTVGLDDNGGAGPFVFTPANFTFKRGEAVNFTLIAEDAFHTFTINELDINVDVNAGETAGLDFVFDQPGTYKLICVPHEALGMVGEIVVTNEPAAAPPPAPAPPPPPAGAAPPAAAQIVEVGLDDNGGGGPFVFTPADFQFAQGSTVTFRMTSEAAFHTFTVNELDLNADVGAGETQDLTFTFDQPGEYKIICIPHEALGMVGTITVQ